VSTRKIVVQSPQKLRKGEPPRPVTGVFGGVRFEDGVSEPVEYDQWSQFAARGNACLVPDKADRLVREARMPEPEEETPSPEALREITPATLESASVPDGYAEREDVPGYHDMLTEVSERGVHVRDFFGGQPRKEPLLKLYFALEEGTGALLATE
jgi:hypothetical protein